MKGKTNNFIPSELLELDKGITVSKKRNPSLPRSRVGSTG